MLLDDYADRDNLTLDICVQDGVHNWPEPPQEYKFGHNVLLAWGTVEPNATEITVFCIEHYEKEKP